MANFRGIEFNENVVDNFRRNWRKKADDLLTVLGKQEQFLNALESPIGVELLKDTILLTGELLEKIVSEKETNIERADYRAYTRILDKWEDRINSYYKNLDAVKKGSVRKK